MKIRYNAPVVLTFGLLSTVILMLDLYAGTNLTLRLFSVPGRGAFEPSSLVHWLRLFTHVLGHASWAHLLGNVALILLLGPMLEEKYGSGRLLGMILVTALATGIANILLFPTGLLGASSVVFMMIILSSFANRKGNEIPLTFILVVIIYLGREISAAFQQNNVSEFAHLIGGLCGSVFGFLRTKGRS